MRNLYLKKQDNHMTIRSLLLMLLLQELRIY